MPHLTARPALPSQLDAALVDALPSGPGVYQFFGDNDLPLYIGKAIDWRKRVLSHFSSDYQRASALAISQQIRRIDWVTTGGEIGALLLEAALIKRLTPIYNRQLRRNDDVCAWRLISQQDDVQLKLASSDELFSVATTRYMGRFSIRAKQHRRCANWSPSISCARWWWGCKNSPPAVRALPVSCNVVVARVAGANRAQAASDRRIATTTHAGLAVFGTDCTKGRRRMSRDRRVGVSRQCALRGRRVGACVGAQTEL